MSDKHGSEDGSRVPGTPDPLSSRLAALQASRSQARDQSAQERALVTPMSAAQARVSQLAGGPDRQKLLAARTELLLRRPLYPPGSPDARPEDAPRTPDPKKPWEGLLQMNHQDFIAFMRDNGANEPLLTFMSEMQMDGPCWRMAITDSNSTQVKDNIEEIIQKWAGDKFSMALVMKITMWSKMAFEQWKEDKDRKPSATSAQNLLSLKDLHSIKVPEPPEGEGLGGRVTAEQVKAYIEALSQPRGIKPQSASGLDFNFRFRENRERLLQRRGEAPHLRPCSPGTPPRYSPHYLL